MIFRLLDLKNISFFRDRAIHYGGHIGNWIAENSTNVPMDRSWQLPWGDNIKRNLDGFDYTDYAFNVLGAWKWSGCHNKTLLNCKGKSAGLYQYVYLNKSGTTRVASTFLITN